jgi:hypothetical protein
VERIDFEKVLLSSALRKAYGAAPKHTDLYTDKTEEAVWAWELTTPTLYVEPPAFCREMMSVRETLIGLAGLI